MHKPWYFIYNFETNENLVKTVQLSEICIRWIKFLCQYFKSYDIQYYNSYI